MSSFIEAAREPLIMSRIWLAGAWLLLAGNLSAAVATLTFDSGAAAKARITSMSWDTEAAALPGRTTRNLLGSGPNEGSAYITATFGKTPVYGRNVIASTSSASSTTFSANGLNFTLTGSTVAGAISLAVSVSGTGYANLTALDLTFEFNPLVTPTTVIPSLWIDSPGKETCFNLPAIISAPDWGQMLLTSTTTNGLRGYLRGTRPNASWSPNYGGQVVVSVQIPPPTGPATFNFSLNPSYLAAPRDVDAASWLKARRGWYGIWQPNANFIGDYSYFLQSRAGILAASADPGSRTRPASTNFNAVGILGNNVVSDMGSGSLWFYADQAYFTPQLAPGVSIATTVKRSVEWWLDNRTFKTASMDLGAHFPAAGGTRPIPKIDAAGQVIYYWYYSDFLDPEAALVIAAWDYVDSTGDVAWLNATNSTYWGAATRLEQLETVAGFLAGRINASKLVAAYQDGTGARSGEDRGPSWWDAMGNGGEDAFLNALAYRSFRCLADLEFKRGNRKAKLREFTTYADRLKDNYEARLLVTYKDSPTITWWRDRPAGNRHGFHSPPINGIAIEYGLTSDAAARNILNGVNGPNTGLWNQISQAGFPAGSPLGLPSNIYPWTSPEYPIFGGGGTFQTYQNGTVFAGHTLHPMVADRLVNGGTGKGNTILQAMLTAQSTAGLEPAFQNGTQYFPGRGKDFKSWNGGFTGYEGFLAEDFAFLQALPLSTPYWRSRFYRPLHPMKTPNDFDYNLCGDLVWREPSTGSNMVWLMNGPTLVSSLTLPSVPGSNTWVMEGIGDFNRDRSGDLLWRDILGNTVVWFMSPTGYVSYQSISQRMDTSFLVRAVTDFGNDDQADILQWNPTSGAVRIWHMNGATRILEQPLPLTRPAPWNLVGVGDLDGDGHPDLVWRNTRTGADEVWFQSFGGYPTAEPLTCTPGWILAGISDFDGDGKADLLWRSPSTGDNQLWLMNGSTVTAFVKLGSMPVKDWNIAGVSDFDGDRRADILWRDTSGHNVIWFMNGGTLLHEDQVQPLSKTWLAKPAQN